MAVDPLDVSNAALAVGSYVVAIGAHQWDFSDGQEYFARTGESFVQPYGTSRRFREVRFIKATTLIEQFRELSYRAGLTGEPVKFTPDVSVPGTFWWIDWPTTMTIDMIEANRFATTVRLTEQAS